MKRFFIFLILAIFFLFIYAYFIDTSGVKVKEYKYESTSLPKGFNDFKIVHFSDFLYEKADDLKHLEQVIKKINEYTPDIIVFTGDLLKNKINDKDKNDLINLLKGLKPELFKYAISGDNDPDDIKDIYDAAGFKYLDNNAEYIFNEDVEPIVIATQDLSQEAMQNINELEYKFAITLIHKPDDYDNLALLGADNLILAGHSLGGQIRIPFWGALIKKNGAVKYSDDYYQTDNKTMYVSYGIGTEKTPFRLFNKPSINVYRLYSK